MVRSFLAMGTEGGVTRQISPSGACPTELKLLLLLEITALPLRVDYFVK